MMADKDGGKNTCIFDDAFARTRFIFSRKRTFGRLSRGRTPPTSRHAAALPPAVRRGLFSPRRRVAAGARRKEIRRAALSFVFAMPKVAKIPRYRNRSVKHDARRDVRL